MFSIANNSLKFRNEQIKITSIMYNDNRFIICNYGDVQSKVVIHIPKCFERSN